MAKTPRKWTGARSPSGLKRVRQTERRRAVLQPRRTAAKTLTSKALMIATTAPEGADPQVALAEAISALDRAAKVGAIHPNAAARRKSRLTRKVNAAIGGEALAAARVTKTTGKAAAAKAAKARIAASKATKAKGAQTAAGKARAALAKTTRAEGPAGEATVEAAPATATKATATKTTATKTTSKKAAGASAAKAAPAEKTAAKTTAGKTTTKAATPAATAETAKTTRSRTKKADEGAPEA